MPTRIDVFAKAREHERSEILRAAREQDLLPYFRLIESPAMPVVEMEGAERVMLGSNNYLGLTADERVQQGAMDALTRYGTGLTGSRLLNGTTPLHLELEREIAEWMNAEDAIVFTTGHQANIGTLGTILGPGDTVIADSGDHASILDGCVLSRAKLRPFRHNRLDLLAKQLRRAEEDGGGVLVVVDGVFSMEGDIAPLQEICDLCEAHGARLMVDEAHGAGVLGARGAGSAELLGVEDRVDLRMGTFSKSLASCGGFIAGPADVVDYLRVQSRAFLFTAERRARRRWAPRWPRCGSCARLTAPRCWPPSSTTRATCATGSSSAAFGSSPRRRCPTGPTWSRRSSRSRSATTGRRRCCGGRSTTRVSSSTPPCTRRCRPAARCCARR